MTEPPLANVPSDEAPPEMFKRHSDVPDPMLSVRHGEQVSTLHREWIRITSPSTGERVSPRQRLTRLAQRLRGTVDQVFIADMIRAVDALAARCDELSDQLQHQQIVLDDALAIYGEELTRLRAESASRGAASSPRATHE